MVQKVNFNNLTGDSLTIGNTTISGTGVTVGGAPLVAGATQYANTSQLPKTNLNFGEFALVGNTLYITNSIGWYSVALINQSPSLSISVSNISLGGSGNTINFTYTASDPDGPTPTVTLETTANTSQANVTLYESNNTVTVENLSAEGYSASITLTATDGIDQTFGTVTLNVGYLSELWDETVLSVDTSSTNSLDNSTFIDRSTNAHTVTPTGSPVQTAFHPYLDNWSVEFNGGGDRITIPHSSDFDFGTGDFTIELWYYPTAIGGSYSTSTIIGTYGNNGGGGWAFQARGGGTFFRFSNGDTALLDANYNLEFYQWYHVAAVRNSGVLSIYVNGVSIGSVADTTNFTYTSPLVIGQLNHSTAVQELFGNLSNIRVVKGTALYTANFTPPTEKITAVSGTSVLLCQDNRFIDNSGNDHSITLTTTPSISAFNPFGQNSEYAVSENKGSVLLDGDTTWLSVPTTGATDFGTGDFTLEYWVYSNAAPDYQVIVDNRTGPTAVQTVFGLNNSLVPYIYDGNEYASSTAVKLNEWNHIAYVRDTNGLAIFLNGERTYLSTSGAPFTTNLTGGGTNTFIGNSSHQTNQYALSGYISNIRISKSALYSSSGTTITVPTSPVGNTNASLYLPFDNAGIYDKTTTHDLTLGGDTSTSTTQTKYSTTSIAFDGTGDYISIPYSPGRWDWSTTDTTIELWVNPTTNGQSGTNQIGLYISQGTYNADSTYWGFGTTSTGYLKFYYWNGSAISHTASTNPLSTGTWYHVAVCHSNGQIYGFVNGNKVIDTAVSGTPVISPSDNLNIGVAQNTYFNGYMENIQFIKNVAKYTTNFTPPTQTQGRVYQATS